MTGKLLSNPSSNESNRLRTASRCLLAAAVLQALHLIAGMLLVADAVDVDGIVALSSIAVLMACIAVQVRNGKWVAFALAVQACFGLLYVASIALLIVFWGDRPSIIIGILTGIVFLLAWSFIFLLKDRRMRAKNRCRDELRSM